MRTFVIEEASAILVQGFRPGEMAFGVHLLARKLQEIRHGCRNRAGRRSPLFVCRTGGRLFGFHRRGRMCRLCPDRAGIGKAFRGSVHAVDVGNLNFAMYPVYWHVTSPQNGLIKQDFQFSKNFFEYHIRKHCGHSHHYKRDVKRGPAEKYFSQACI